jgi:endonuclease-3
MNSKLAVKQLKAIEKLNLKREGVMEMRLAAQWPEEYQMLIATILSAQTRDEVTIEVCDILFFKYPTMKDLAEASVEDVRKIISKVNYSPTKSGRIIETAKMVMEGGGKIPNKLIGLIEYPGVGRKVANVYLSEAHKADAIGVDTHVARISYKLGWTKFLNPDKIEKDLEKLFPRKYWKGINETLVRFGKSYGLSRKKEDVILETLIN